MASSQPLKKAPPGERSLFTKRGKPYMKILKLKRTTSKNDVRNSTERVLYIITFSLISLTLLSGLVLSSSASSALVGNSEQSNVSVTVSNSCTMSGQIITPHTDTIPNGTLHNGIGSTKMKIYCNDTGGYTVYAIGSGNDEDGNTNMVSSLGSNDIATGSSTSGSTSSWAMQLTAGTGTGSITTPPTILDGYDSYHNIPGAYTAVARRSSATEMDTDVDVTGSYFTTTYRVYVGSNQPAANYTGKVKYAVIHPYNGESTLTTLQDALAAASAPTTTGTDGNTYYALHGLTSTICNNATITGTNSVTKLADARDGNIYTVAKLADNKCWLLDNLRLDPTDTNTRNNMSAANTHAPAEAITNYLNGSQSAPHDGWSTVAVADVDTNFNSFTDPMINNSEVNTEVTSYGPAANNGKAKVGIYYNYCAATVGTYCYSDGQGIGDASYDVCPANWRMPTGGVDGEYQSLCSTLWGSECSNGMSMDATDANSLQYNLSTTLAGTYDGSQISSQGVLGHFWSSTRGSSYNMYDLTVRSVSAYPLYNLYRRGGFSVRCVTGDGDGGNYMQEMDNAKLASLMPNVGDTTTLVDKRDSQKYMVGKLADGKYWLLENLRLDPTAVSPNAMKGNTNAPNEAIDNYYHPTGTAPQSGWSTVAVEDVDTNFNSYTEPRINNASKDMEVTSYGPAAVNGKGKVGIYYNYCAATVGTYCYDGGSSIGNANSDICATGWRMPTGGDNGEYQSLCNILYGSKCTNPTPMAAIGTDSLQYNLSTPLSGYYEESQTVYLDSLGYFWSSIRYGGYYMYRLSVISSNVYPYEYSHRYYGFPVRCLFGS